MDVGLARAHPYQATANLLGQPQNHKNNNTPWIYGSRTDIPAHPLLNLS